MWRLFAALIAVLDQPLVQDWWDMIVWAYVDKVHALHMASNSVIHSVITSLVMYIVVCQCGLHTIAVSRCCIIDHRVIKQQDLNLEVAYSWKKSGTNNWSHNRVYSAIKETMSQTNAQQVDLCTPHACCPGDSGTWTKGLVSENWRLWRHIIIAATLLHTWILDVHIWIQRLVLACQPFHCAQLTGFDFNVGPFGLHPSLVGHALRSTHADSAWKDLNPSFPNLFSKLRHLNVNLWNRTRKPNPDLKFTWNCTNKLVFLIWPNFCWFLTCLCNSMLLSTHHLFMYRHISHRLLYNQRVQLSHPKVVKLTQRRIRMNLVRVRPECGLPWWAWVSWTQWRSPRLVGQIARTDCNHTFRKLLICFISIFISTANKSRTHALKDCTIFCETKYPDTVCCKFKQRPIIEWSDITVCAHLWNLIVLVWFVLCGSFPCPLGWFTAQICKGFGEILLQT